MNNAIALGGYVYFGARKGIVIEKKAGKITVCWLGVVQTIAENIPAWAVTLTSTNIRRKVGQTRRDALRAHILTARTASTVTEATAIVTDRSVVFAGILALVAVAFVLYSFVTGIAIPFHV